QRSKAWAVFMMDDTPNKDGLSHGGTGKSIFFYAVEQIKKMAYLDGKNAEVFNKDHSLEVVKHDTDFLYVDDTAHNFDFERLFSMVTGLMPINPKGKAAYNLTFDVSPKIALSSNFTPGKMQDSTLRRILFCGMSNYYHYNTSGEFKEIRQPPDDFGKDLFKDFDDREWNLFYNFAAHCCQLFLSYDMISAPMDNIMMRNLSNDMGLNFLAWAEIYFSDESGRLNILVPTAVALEDYQRDSNLTKMASNLFNHKLDLYCRFKGWKMNPKEVYGKSDRLTKYLAAPKFDMKTGKWTRLEGVKRTQTFFYLQTTDDTGAYVPVDPTNVFDPSADQDDLPTPTPGTEKPKF
ncbi:MAG: primase-helicase family protein, partial [Sphingobacterium sp.]